MECPPIIVQSADSASEYEKCKKDLEKAKEKILLLERKAVKLSEYNEELTNELNELKSQFHELLTKSRVIKVDSNTQTETPADDPIVQEVVYEPIANELSDVADGSRNCIADILRATAEQAVSQSDYVYDETSGMYYDQRSGYYYDPSNQLFFDSSTYTYYTYNYEEGTYEYHSQADASHYSKYLMYQQKKKEKSQRRARRELKQKNLKRDSNDQEFSTRSSKLQKTELSAGSDVSVEKTDDESPSSDVMPSDAEAEEGELMSSGDELSSSDPETELIWRTPCIRAVITQSDSLEVGSLHIITISGGSIGRGTSCTISIPEDTLNEVCCEIYFCGESRNYFLTHIREDGQFLIDGEVFTNGLPNPYRICHRAVVKCGSTEILFHIHPGTDTCSECEPGVICKKLVNQSAAITTKVELENDRKSILKSIKKKYGLDTRTCFGEKPAVGPKYEDKAQRRRQEVGSDNPYIRDAEPASVDTAISNENVGHKLLTKMGWKEGGSIGKTSSGIKEPVQVDIRLNPNAGLGSVYNSTASMDDGGNIKVRQKKTHINLKTKQRYKQAEEQPSQDQNI